MTQQPIKYIDPKREYVEIKEDIDKGIKSITLFGTMGRIIKYDWMPLSLNSVFYKMEFVLALGRIILMIAH